MSWIDRFFAGGYANVQIAGVPLAPETTINFATGAAGADDPTNDATIITIAPATPGATLGLLVAVSRGNVQP